MLIGPGEMDILTRFQAQGNGRLRSRDSHLWRRGCGRNRSVSQGGSDSALGRLRCFVGIGMQVIS